jgi:putative ABC transport system substrate-binding protein
MLRVVPRVEENDMKRRVFIKLITAAGVVKTFAANAQPITVPVVGLLNSEQSTEQLRVDAFLQRFRELGWVEGRSVIIEARWSYGRPELIAEIVAEFVRLKVAAILTSGAGPVSAARQATKTIPIVFAIATDPVGTGLVTTLARPGGNATGLSYMGTDLPGKRVELLRGVVTGLAHLAILANGGAPGAMLELRKTQAMISTLGLEAISVEITTSGQIAPAIAALRNYADALYICPDPLINANRMRIVTSALDAGLPTVFGERENVDAGGLMSYGPNVPQMYRRAAEIVDKILRGANPATIPVEQPTKFEFILNLKTAKALGFDVPLKFQQLADEVID